jgi:uncharacterized membrane protein YoaK (UPF0700 family)
VNNNLQTIYTIGLWGTTGLGAIIGFCSAFENTVRTSDTTTCKILGGMVTGTIGFVLGAICGGLVGVIWPISLPLIMYDMCITFPEQEREERKRRNERYRF